MAKHNSRNVSFKKKSDKITVTTDLSVGGFGFFYRKTTVLATTRGAHDLGEVHKEFKGVKLNINTYRKK